MSLSRNEKIFKIYDRMFPNTLRYNRDRDFLYIPNSEVGPPYQIRPDRNIKDAFGIADELGLFEKNYLYKVGAKWVIKRGARCFGEGRTPQDAIVDAIIFINETESTFT